MPLPWRVNACPIAGEGVPMTGSNFLPEQARPARHGTTTTGGRMPETIWPEWTPDPCLYGWIHRYRRPSTQATDLKLFNSNSPELGGEFNSPTRQTPSGGPQSNSPTRPYEGELLGGLADGELEAKQWAADSATPTDQTPHKSTPRR